MQDITVQIEAYLQSLAAFIEQHALPGSWFKVPDHLATKAADSTQCEQLIATFRPAAKRIACVELDNRRLATAELKKPIALGPFGKIGWFEIMEPRPEKVGHDVVGLEHMEFLYPDFAAAQAVLDEAELAYELQTNPGHSWINIAINKQGQELKLSNRLISGVVSQELANGIAYLL